MSFFKKSLQALGFGNEPEDKSQVYTAKNITDMTGKDRSQPNKVSQPTATTARPQVTKPQATEPVAEAQPVTNNTPDNDNNNNNTSVVPDILLDKVVELVNASLPDFVRNCIDIEAEKKYIYEQLGDSFKTYVNNLNTSARQQSEANINSTRKQLENEMSSLRRKTTELEEQKAELKNQQLSTERQKRALNERIHDLEGRITTLEAEKEQYELENKSLINRLKVSGIKQQEVDEAQEEITRLLGVIQEMKQNGTVPAEVQEELTAKDTAIETLKAELAQLTEQQAPLSAITDELNAQNEMLKTQVDELNKLYNEAQDTIANLNNDNTQLNASIADHTAQVAELNSTIETLSQENNKLQAASDTLEQDNLSHNEQVTTLTLKIETLTAEKEALNTEKEALTAEIATKDNNIALLKTELESAKNQQISDNLKLNTLQANEQEIITLKASLDKSNNRCNELESAIEKLRLSEQQANKTLNDNQAKIDQCNSTIDELNNQIDELNKALEILEKVEAKVAQYEKLEQQKNAINNDNKELKKRIEQLEGELINAKKETARLATQPAQSTDSSEELEKANNMIAALKKQRQELVSQTATLRSQNKAYENQIASLESKLSNDSHSTISFEGIATDIDEAINWMMPVLPDSLEEEARRKEEEERQRREEEERERQAEKERRALRDDSSSQMSLW